VLGVHTDSSYNIILTITELFGDDQVASIILKNTDPKKQKELGRRVRNFDPSIWTDHCEDIVKLANFLKVCVPSVLVCKYCNVSTSIIMFIEFLWI